jgi:hypothetical protein
MDEMTAFERQISREVVREAGPDPRFDALSIARSVARHRRTWRLQSMIGATKLVLGVGVVGVFSGVLLVTVSTNQPSAESVPAAALSPTPIPELLPGVDLVTDEVDRGVFRVLSDGTDYDLSFGTSGNETTQVVAGQDGSVWLFDQARLHRLGQAASTNAMRLDPYGPDISVAPDGTVSALRRDSPWGSSRVHSLTEGEWISHPLPEGAWANGIETPADGSIWASVAVDGCGPYHNSGRLAVARLVDEEWLLERIEPASSADGASLAIGPDGTTLLGRLALCGDSDASTAGLLERGPDGWEASLAVEPTTGGDGGAGFGPIAIGRDGTVWAYQSGQVDPWGPRLHRRTDGDWEIFGEDGSVPMLIGEQMWDGSTTLTDDGRLWFAFDHPVALDTHRAWGNKSVAGTLDGGCAGVLSFDGTSWGQHLAGACATFVSAAPDGNVWVAVVEPEHLAEWAAAEPDRALDPARARSGLYVITPEAVAASVGSRRD